MPTTLDLTTLSRTSLRLLLACCAKALDPDATTTPTQAVWQRLRREHGWVPTATDCPLPLATVQAWVETEEQTKLRRYLETQDEERL